MPDMRNLQYEKIKLAVEDLIKFNDFKEAFNFYNELGEASNKSDYRKSNPELYSKFKKLLVKLQWIALPFFKKEEALRLFNNSFQETLEMEYFDHWDKLKHFLLGFILAEDRDKFKAAVKKILEKNQARITSEKLENNLSPTIENWIKVYTSSLGTGVVDTVKLRQFFISHKEIKKLGPEEKAKLENFFRFYEKLKLTSASVAGFEGSLPISIPESEFKGYIENGQLVKEPKIDSKLQKLLREEGEITLPRKSPDNDLEILREAAGRYGEGSLERKAIEEEMRRLRK